MIQKPLNDEAVVAGKLGRAFEKHDKAADAIDNMGTRNHRVGAKPGGDGTRAFATAAAHAKATAAFKGGGRR